MKSLGMTLAFIGSLVVSGTVAGETAPPPNDKLACRGVPQTQWDASCLTKAEDIRKVQEIKADVPMTETEASSPRAGARILLRAQPGVTVEWLERIAECHMARIAVSSPVAPTQSPLDIRGASISVQSAGDGFAVDITSPDRDVAKQILARAKALVRSPPPTP